MQIILAIVIGLLYAAGVYLMLRRNIVKLIIGVAFLGHATNLLIFTVGNLSRRAAALIPAGAELPAEPIADPLPQALILTAIVIGFGAVSFAIVLLRGLYHFQQSDDLDAMRIVEN